MWFGKVAIIIYIFSLALMFSGYFMESTLGDGSFDENSLYADLDAVATAFNPNETVSAELIFGDFIAGVRVLFGVMTFQPISDAFAILPNMDMNILLLIRVLFGASSIFLWIFIITGRSV